jgi:WD40 repeat protein
VQDAMTGWIKFLWRDRDGTIGQDAYTPDGVPIYRVKLLGPEWPEGHRYTGPEVSPDGDWAVLGTGTQYFSLQLAATDGSTTKVIRPSSERTSSYTWSPDSSRFAFVYYDNTSYFIDVFDKNGVELQRFVGSHDPGILTWTRCN